MSLNAAEHLADILDNADRFLGPEKSQKLERLFLKGFEELAANPNWGHPRHDLIEGPYCYRLGDYMIFYERYSLPTEILAIYHGAQDIASHFPHR